ncbi:hypothetical protein BGZ65_005416, partial [Modicella reniformis]
GNSPDTEPSLTTTSVPAASSTQASSAAAAVFSWRELYETASRFQLAGLMHLAKLVLISRLDTDLALRELFEWAYRYWMLVPSYVSFLIENMNPTLLRCDQYDEGRRGRERERGPGLRLNVAPDERVSKSVFWPYHDRCPRFDDIMVMFLQMLNERKNSETLV